MPTDDPRALVAALSVCRRAARSSVRAELLPEQARALSAEVDRLLAKIERLRAIEKRLEETTTWCGVDQMHRAIEYIRTGSTPEARALLGATDTPADTVQSRLDHLAQLEEGWDSYGAAPMQPGIRDRITTLLGHLRQDPLIVLTPSGGSHLTWGANEDVCIELEPDGAVTALIEDRDLGATDTTPAPSQPGNHGALTITTLPKPVTGLCSCGASTQVDYEGQADAWWATHRAAEGVTGETFNEWCSVHNEEMQDHDCDLVDTPEEPTDAAQP